MTGLLPAYVTRQADRRPESVAVVTPDARATYAEIEARSNQIARLLRDAGCRRGDRVGLLAAKSLPAITALLGIYKADCVYVPIDPGSPAPRAARMLAISEPRLLLADAAAGALVRALHAGGLRTRFGWLPPAPADTGVTPVFEADAAAGRAYYAPAPRNRPDDAAHILFTSGSTGEPKGVVITHANVTACVDWGVAYFGTRPGDRQSCHSPLPFDLSIYDIFSTFAGGGALYLVPEELNLLPNRVADFIRERRLTQWFSVPALLGYMARLDVVRPNDFPWLKRLLWCGEVLPTPTLMYWMRRLPHVTFTNLYGPTETTIASSYYTMPACPTDAGAAIPIGRPCPGESLHVLDDDLHPAPAGTVGELYIGGVGLSPGYWRRPEATRAAFVASPIAGAGPRLYRTGDLASIGSDGLFYFHGRTDSQIKSRGYRIELGEIETALRSLAGLADCAVVAVESGGFEGARICCACVPAADRAPTPATLRRQLGALLPAYMIPTDWLVRPALPTNGNGKIDRPALREEFRRLATDAARQPAAG